MFRGDLKRDDLFELYSVPIDGSAAYITLSTLVDLAGDVETFEITADGQYVVYSSDEETSAARNIYGVPIGGGTAVQLNTQLWDPGGLEQWQLAGSHVVFLDNQRLYSAPVDGSGLLSLSPGAVDSFVLNQQTIVFAAGNLFRIQVTGGRAQQVSDVQPGQTLLPDFAAAGGRFVYRIEEGNVIDLYSSSLTRHDQGNPPPAPGGTLAAGLGRAQ